MAAERENYERVRQQVENNDPPIEVGQVWIAYKEDGKILRRLMILALYPECGIQEPSGTMTKSWIYEELSGGSMQLEIGRLGICPEFNLRYIFTLVT